MSPLGELPWSLLVILAIAALAHEPWRWAGLVIGARLDPDGEVFQWVRAVSNALVAALCTRLIAFPAGALEAVHWGVRGTALAIGIAAFFLMRRHLGAGILSGCAALVALKTFG